jgi:Putative peptidoglycan binding domain
MQPKKFRILSAIIIGSLALTAAAITASSGTSQPATHVALVAHTESFPPVNPDDCPTLHIGYPNGGCVAQLQTYLNSIPGYQVTVDGTFASQTYKAVIAFQQAHGLKPDGLVGPATKAALDAALSVPTPTLGAPLPTPSTTAPVVPLDPSCLASTASPCGSSPDINHEVPGLNEILDSLFG